MLLRSIAPTVLAFAAFTVLFVETAPAQPATTRPRILAPGVETTILRENVPEETLSVHPLVELRAKPSLKWTPHYSPESRTLYAKAAEVNFRRQIWCLEFIFKPLRMVEVDVPQPSGKMQRKLIWYMVYRVKNVGGQLDPKKQDDGTFTTETVAQETRFIPQFVLESIDPELKGSGGRNKAYLDRVIPVAKAAIVRREKPPGKLYNSVQIAAVRILPSTDRLDRSVWGFVTWENIDPRIDYFSIYVKGLTNAYKWEDPQGAYRDGKPPGTGRRFVHKELKLNFWRPGDQYDQTEKEIQFGTPVGKSEMYRVPKGVDHVWLYR